MHSTHLLSSTDAKLEMRSYPTWIVLSAGTFGAVNLFCTALTEINRSWAQRKTKKLLALDILNGAVLCFSGGMLLVTSISALKLLR